MTHTASTRPTAPAEPEHDWAEAGEAWGRAAHDWAYLYEHYSLDAMGAMFEDLGVGAGTTFLDVACGSGLALRVARGRGAAVAGIDAAAPLVRIARERNPGVEVVVGSMFDLPWPDASFDAVTSINGIWGGCEAAVVEAARVLRPGGMLGFSFWGQGPPLDLKHVFRVFARHVPERNYQGMKRLNNIAFPGVAEQMVADAGLELVHRDSRISTLELADDEIAWRAMTSTGPARPALEHGDVAAVRREVLEAMAPARDGAGGYRFANDHQFVIARKPA